MKLGNNKGKLYAGIDPLMLSFCYEVRNLAEKNNGLGLGYIPGWS